MRNSSEGAGVIFLVAGGVSAYAPAGLSYVGQVNSSLRSSPTTLCIRGKRNLAHL
jgi:hypothetical protein